MSVELLVIEIAGERRALPAQAVLEIVELGNLTPVPTAPAVVCGLIQLRGRVLPVLDLASPADPSSRPPRAPRPGAPLVVVEIERAPAALLADRVGEVVAEGECDARRIDLAQVGAEVRRQVEAQARG